MAKVKVAGKELVGKMRGGNVVCAIAQGTAIRIFSQALVLRWRIYGAIARQGKR